MRGPPETQATRVLFFCVFFCFLWCMSVTHPPKEGESDILQPRGNYSHNHKPHLTCPENGEKSNLQQSTACVCRDLQLSWRSGGRGAIILDWCVKWIVRLEIEPQKKSMNVSSKACHGSLFASRGGNKASCPTQTHFLGLLTLAGLWLHFGESIHALDTRSVIFILSATFPTAASALR